MNKTLHIAIGVLLFLVSTSITMYAQGNACSSATTLTVNCTCSTGNINDATVNDPTETNCATIVRDAWYNFTAISASSTVTFTNTAATRDAEIFVYSGACGSLTYINCVNATGNGGNETITFATTIGVVYSVRIARITAAGNPALTGTTCVTSTSPMIPDCATLTIPANATTGLCPSAVTLNWTAPTCGTPPTTYKLFFGTDAGATNINNGTNIGNVLTYNSGTLLPNTVYYWRIVSTNAQGDATGCTTRSFTTGAFSACNYNQQTTTISTCGGNYYDSGGSGANYGNNENSTITFCPSTAGQYISVTFSAFNTQANNDVLTIYNGPNTSSPILATLSGNGLPACPTFISTAVGGCLTFRFVSNNSTNAAGWTASLNCVSSILPSCAALTTPANNATGLCPFTTTLNWNVNTCSENVTGYKLFFGTNIAATNVVNGVNLGNVLTYNPGTLLSNTTYYWTVVAVNGAGDAIGCTIRQFTTGNGSSCTFNQQNGSYSVCGGTFYDSGGSGANYANNENSTITFCPSNAGDYIQVTFSAFNTQATNDVLTIYNGPDATYPILATLSGNALPTCPTVTSSNPGGCLTFRFISNGSTVASGWAASLSCVPDPPIPNCANYTTPTNAATGLCNATITLNWTAPTGCGGATTNYLLYFGTDPSATNISNGVSLGNVLTYNPGVLNVSTTYYWKIVPQNSGGDASGCATRSFTTATAALCSYNQQTTSITTCAGTYYDSGGPGANYSNNENSTITFCPGTIGQYIQVIFSVFNTEATNDVLTVYNGPNTSSPVLDVISGNALPGCPTFTSTHITGCLTFRFVSNGSTNRLGWVASINCVSVAPVSPIGSTCGNAPTITLPYSATAQTTACYGNNYNNGSTGSCATTYESGQDRVYKYIATGSECIAITLTNLSSDLSGFQVYNGCPGAGGTTCVGSAGGAAGGFVTGNVTLPTAGTYYIIVDSWAAPNFVNYDINIISYGAGAINDLPCNAISLTLGNSEFGNNFCSGSAGEPATPSCWTGGIRNTVWYKVIAPASASLRIKTFLGSLTNTQMAVYSGTCGAGMTMIGCNQNSAACGNISNVNSELLLTGLTVGATYYVAIDGANNLLGTFTIIALNGNQTFPPVTGMDCPAPNLVCNQYFTVSNPGYAGFGNTCDLPYPAQAGNCLGSGERNIVWYTIPINASGFLEFTIVPNDFDPIAQSSTDYDFGIWKTGGAGSVTCAQIASGAANPLRCNYDYRGVTGLSSAATNTAPSAPLSINVCSQCYPPGTYAPNPTFNAAFDSRIAVVTGDVYLLGISNYSNSTSGFAIDFLASPIGYVGTSPSMVTWTGGTDTDPLKPSNWGGCNIPTCAIDAVVPPFANQPIINTNQTVKDFTIQIGAQVRINPGVTVTICGNFTNNGSLIMAPTATILFNNTANHLISGNFTGSNAIGNITINQTAGSVQLLSDLDIKGNLTTATNTSELNTNQNYIKIAGNFNNAAGDITFTNNGTAGTLEFNGTAAQNYNQGNLPLYLNNVVMNHTGSGVNMLTNMRVKSSTGTLTLNQGKLISNAFEVIVHNTTPSAVTTGNTNSFVQGNLRRYLDATGSYNFPVGHASKGYQLANIDFTTVTNIGNLLARFDTWTITPITEGETECGTTYNLQSQDNGIWTITADANAASGTYTTTLFPSNVTNSSGAAVWTVMKTDATEAGPWFLDGNCDPSSTASIVIRDGMVGFSKFGVAQALVPLPIELLSFTGKNYGSKNLLEWVTASEINNDYFTLERSRDAINFEQLAIVDAAGNSTSVIYYKHFDELPFDNLTYYRLKQTDFDGKFHYSSIIAINHNKGFNFEVTGIQPNPTKGELKIAVLSPKTCNLIISIYDYTGHLVIKDFKPLQEGKSTIVENFGELAIGLYSIIIEVENSDFHFVSKIIKN